MKMEELITNRLKLRKITPEVFDYIYQNLSETEQIEFLGLSSKEALETEKSKYRKGLRTYNKTFLYFHIIEKKSGKTIGWCGYHTWYTDHNRAEIGYGLFIESYKRKGFMSEAIVSIIEYGFKQMKLHRIEAFISPQNVASIRLINKLNFTKEGLLREHYFINNRMEDSAIYSLLKSEFK
jgi:ribosomal-protein-alanine N-acetyltransferase